MKPASSAVQTLLAGAMGGGSGTRFLVAECFTFTTTIGAVYTWTNVDFDVFYNSLTFSSSGPLVQGLKFKQTVGLEVDKQQIMIAAQADRSHQRRAVPDRAARRRFRRRERPARPRVPDRARFGRRRRHPVQGPHLDGRSGRAHAATLTVASDLVILDYDMPKNLFSPTCVHTLYDAGCGVIRGTYAATGTAGAGSTSSVILSAVAAAQPCARLARLHVGRQRQRAGDGQERRRRFGL